MTEELSFLTSQINFLKSGEGMSQLKEVVSTPAKKDDRLTFFLEQYNQYKTCYVKHLLFDPDEQSLSKILYFGNM